ncbi:MAG: glycoside hydrolase family 5 protein [Hyphomonadaceae bacterium]|nr:glycoside hydrolase family 5 protein [Hyphomonadaceae bacterium]
MKPFSRLLAGLAMFASVAGCAGETVLGDPATEAGLPESPIARCINISNALEAPAEGEWGYTVQTRHLAAIAAAGFDTVRLPVNWSDHTGPGPEYRIDPVRLQRVDEVVEAALAAGLQVIVDVHHFHAFSEDPAKYRPELVAIWHQLSEHFQAAPEGVILELLNEPHTEIGIGDIEAVNAELLAIVRETNPDRWVVLGSTGWGGLEEWAETDWPDDPRILTTFHYYEPWEFTHEGAEWLEEPPEFSQSWGARANHAAAVVKHFEQAHARALASGHPVLLGEFGVYRDLPAGERAAWTRTVREQAETAGFGWCYWGFGTAFRAYDLEAEAWLPEMTEALGVTP